MSASSKGNRFDRSFKIDAVRLITKEGHRVADVARSIGVHENTLYKWLKLYREDPKESFSGSVRLKSSVRHKRWLANRITDLEEENAILKKALAIFSQNPE